VSRLVQQLVNGTVLGATIGLIALGYTMVYGIIQLINFAHGEIFMIGSYAGLAAYTYVLPDSVTKNPWITLPVVLLAAAARRRWWRCWPSGSPTGRSATPPGWRR